MEPEEAEVAAFLGAGAERVIETACARVFLTADAAFKVKRHVALGYVDFTTLERRSWAIGRELDFNRATAPDIYRAARRLTRRADGGLELDGPGPTVEAVLEMRRFDETAVLSVRPEAIDGALCEALGRGVAASHAAAPVRPEAGGGAGIAYTLDSNAELLRGLGARLGREQVERLIAGSQAAFRRLEPLLEARRAAGFVRRCHGDLHLGNILLEAGRPVLFDCIEFNDKLSEIDVLYDLAFLLMDLEFRGRRDGAVRVLSAYLDQAARRFPPTLWDGLAALPLMLSMRAAVRAHVSANSGDDAVAGRYLDAALAHLDPPPPRLMAVGGLSGTGKTTYARAVAPTFGPSPGAVILRTDEIRKRLAGVAPEDRLGPEAYTAERDAAVHGALFADAARALAAGRAVILDATFMDPARRQAAEAVAAVAGVAFEGVWLEVAPDVARARLAARRGDASDATAAVLARQLAADVGAITWTRRWAADASAPAQRP